MKSLEELYLEFVELGWDEEEISERLESVIYYRYMDTLAPSEQVLREQQFAGFQVVDFDDYESPFSSPKQTIPDWRPIVNTLAESMKEFQDKLNDVLIEQYLHSNKENTIDKKEKGDE